MKPGIKSWSQQDQQSATKKLPQQIELSTESENAADESELPEESSQKTATKSLNKYTQPVTTELPQENSVDQENSEPVDSDNVTELSKKTRLTKNPETAKKKLPLLNNLYFFYWIFYR